MMVVESGEVLTLVSHTLCPYVQRAAIVLAEKAVPFVRRWVDLASKPEWFMAISPLGKTPVLLVGEAPIFESAAICEYLDETLAPRLHPVDPLARARHRGWVEVGSAMLTSIAAFYNAKDEFTLQARARDMRGRFEQLEVELGCGPFFAGEAFCIVDAVFRPVFRYFDLFDAIDDFGCLAGLSKVSAWRTALAVRASVREAVRSDYPDELRAFLLALGSALSSRIERSTPS